MPTGRALALAASLFFLSGLGALVVETLWLRWFRLLLGATAPAVSATLVAFFAGQALGARLGGRWAGQHPHPLRLYATLECAAVLCAAAVPVLLVVLQGPVDAASDSLRARPAALSALRFGVALVAAFPAGVAFGATLPALAAFVLGEAGALGRRGAALLAANTLGGAAGVALASFVLPPWIGVGASYAVGLGAIGIAALVAFAARHRPPLSAPPDPQTSSLEPGLSRAALAALALLSGVGVFAGQSLVVQAFARVLNQSTQAFGVVLMAVLLSLGLAAWVGAFLCTRLGARTLLGWAGVAAAVGWAGFPAIFVGATDGLGYWGTARPWPGYLLSALGLALATAGPPLFASGLVLPAVLHAAGAEGGTSGEGASRLGRLLAWNTGGAVMGALLAPFVLLPTLGLWLGVTALAVLYGAAAVLVPAPPGRPRLLRDGALAIAWLVLMTRGSPLQLPALRVEPGDRLLFAEETSAGLVAVVERQGGRFLQVDNHYALGGTADRVHQERQGHLPLLLHPAPRRALFLGSATGGSAGAALAHPVQELTLVELVPGVARAAPWFREANRGVFDAGRSRLVIDDARSYLRSTAERFEVIVADLFVPWRAGTGSLYAQEHFQAARDHLTDGGVFCQWLPLYQLGEEEALIIARTFHTVFPNAVVFRGDFFGRFPIAALIGFADAPPPVDGIEARVRQLAATGEQDRWVTRPEGLWSLYVGALDPLAEALVDLPVNRDDRPTLEFLAARSHAGGAGGKREAFVGSRWIRFAKALREASLSDEPAFAGLGERQRVAGDGGHALQTAGALFSEGQRERASQALSSAARQLPRELLADAPADPTAATVWPEGNPR